MVGEEWGRKEEGEEDGKMRKMRKNKNRMVGDQGDVRWKGNSMEEKKGDGRRKGKRTIR
jgi:hypothetical protein